MTYTSSGFKDKVFFRNMIIAILGAVLSVYVIFHTETGYAAMSVISISSFVIGFLEPRRGWVLALIQATIIVLCWLIQPFTPAVKDLAMFASYASIFISLFFSFVAGRLGRMFEN